MLVQNAVAMWLPNRAAKSMQNVVPILAQYGGCIGAIYAKYSSHISAVLAALLSKVLAVFVYVKA